AASQPVNATAKPSVTPSSAAFAGIETPARKDAIKAEATKFLNIAIPLFHRLTLLSGRRTPILPTTLESPFGLWAIFLGF
ncbi:hypothetical protein, partial [Rhizobium giardinii]|uniref:hypothetical protein n=1 Tax=Rhizobium giardinii TaxID=56731 RepID=UPI001AEBBDFE